MRCTRSAQQHRRLFADHVKERRDDGDPIDPSNGMCLRRSHHTIKTQRERARRLGATGGGGA
jgi:5-methylcytosine-specific restriction enzyme A